MRAILTVLLSFSLAAGAQVAAPQPQPTRPPTVSTPVPMPAQIDPETTAALGQLEQAAQAANLDVAKLRIEKWKADSAVKKQAQENADSIQRNLSAALPGMVQQVRANPQSLAAAFKLYRNLNVLYEVLSNVAESAGAFGQKSEFQALASDAQNLDAVRRTFSDRLQTMAANHDAEVVRLRAQVAQAQAAPVAPKRIIVDDESPKKPARKKKAAPKPNAQAGTAAPAAKPQ
jgi:hypothetical protein